MVVNSDQKGHGGTYIVRDSYLLQTAYICDARIPLPSRGRMGGLMFRINIY
jgi:hypothetical protein